MNRPLKHLLGSGRRLSGVYVVAAVLVVVGRVGLGDDTSPAEEQHHDLGAGLTFGLCSLDHSSKVKLFPMDRLQREQIGTKFSKDVVPPLDSGMLCPAWKVYAVIKFGHHDVLHLPEKNIG